jgi:hypothetical protein
MTEDFVHKQKSYRKLSTQTIKDAISLFLSYMDGSKLEGKRWYRGVSLADGEQKSPQTNEEFFLYYDEPGTSGFIAVENNNYQARFHISYNNRFTIVDVKLPSREQVDNVLRKLTRAEELLSISDPPKQTKIEEIIGEMQGLLTSSTIPTIFIGHGRDEQWRTLEGLLRRDGFQNIVYYESEYRAAQSITDVLEEMLNQANIAVIVMTGEDRIMPDNDAPSSDIIYRGRENVIHEAGLFQGKYSFSRAIILLEEGCNEFSNIKVLTQINFHRERIG